MYICIFGGGPTGLRLADELSKLGHRIELHDKETKLGGCWKVDWEKGYYTEHAPRVMSSAYSITLSLLKKYNVKTDYVYGTKLYTMKMFLDYFYTHLSFTDISKVLAAMMFINDKKKTMKEWMDENNISKEGKKALRKLGLSLITNENEFLAYIFFKTIKEGQGSNLIQSKDNDLWILKWEKELSERDNVKIFTNSKLTKLICKNNKIVEAKTTTQTCKPDICICAMPLYALKQLVSNCSKAVQINWMEYEKFKKYCYESSYSGLGFQFHFTEEQRNINLWKEKCFTDWDIEIIKLNTYSNQPTRHSFIKEVWSCVIVDTNAVSTFLDKKVNEIDDINTIINEALRQLSNVFGMSITPYKVTIAKGITYNKEKKYWDMEHSAYNPFRDGPLPSKGTIDNLYSVGPHNLEEIALLESAFKSADQFIKMNF